VNVLEKLTPLRRASPAVVCLVVSTAECERSFNAMNDTARDTRSSLLASKESTLLFAKLVGLKDVIAVNPKSYVRNWLASGRHSTVYCKS